MGGLQLLGGGAGKAAQEPASPGAAESADRRPGREPEIQRWSEGLKVFFVRLQ